MRLIAETNEASLAAIKADFLIAKAMARQHTKGHLVFYDREKDEV